MAITGAIFNSLIYGGVDSADYGVYITGDAVFNAPKRSVELVSVPGRNGSIEIDQGHFENIEVSYPAGMFGDDKTDFRERLSDFRNAIMAQKGYQRLSDTYHPDEYRMGIYVDGLEVDPKHYNEAGQFTLKFNCKPQRWLTSGEEPIDVMAWGETETLSGEIVTFEAEDETIGIKSVSADINPIQDLHGYDKPWAGGNGKNKLPLVLDDIKASNTQGTWNANSYTRNGLTFKVNADADGNITDITVTGTATSTTVLRIDGVTGFSVGTFALNGCPSGGNTSTTYCVRAYKSGNTLASDTGSGTTFTDLGTATNTYIGLLIWNGYNCGSGVVFKPMVRLASETDASFEPYSNICPISGWDDEMIYVSPTEDEEDATTYVIDLGGTRYGGTLDVTSGVMNVCPYYASYNGETLAGEWISDRDEYIPNTSPTIGAQVVDIGGTTTSVQLTPTQIEALVGEENHVWASTGEVTVEYGMQPGYITNPTLFDAQPLLYAEGSGKIEFNGYEIEIADIVFGNVTVWEQGPEEIRYSPTYTKTIPAGLFNVGDSFTLDSFKFSYSDTYNGQPNSYSDASTSITHSGIEGVTGVAKAVISSNGARLDFGWDVIVPPIDFVYGTAKTMADAEEYSLTYSINGDPHTENYSSNVTITYDGNSTVEIKLVGRVTTAVPACKGVSTVPLGAYNMYIDCEIGEAYYIEDGEIVSLNAYIDLGSDLPVLAPGINNITYDDSIDVLNVTPRWWKV